jgi:hypothetical protein
MIRRIAWVVTCVVLTGCVSVSKSVLTREYASQPVPRDNVYVFLKSAGDEIPASCRRVAILHASGPEAASEGTIVDRLREEAGKLGANAVWIQTMEEPGVGERIAGTLLGIGVDKDSDAIALHCALEDLRDV